ncbi:MAG: uroporphyrinogen-III synthase [Chloroflexota bacterium]|nr:MAG: uroporphyrinogen-III synthase [Chloroflexota bacterium]
MLRVLITRPRSQADDFAGALTAAGMEPIFFPVIEIGRVDDSSALDAALLSLDRFDWMILTSVNGVEAVWERLEALNIGALPANLRIAAIGPKTAAALQAHGIVPDFIPGEYIAEAILPGLGDLYGRSVLLPRAELARKALAEAIQQAGGNPREIIAYHTLPARPDSDALQALHAGVDVVTFTSSSTVRNFVSLARAEGLNPAALPGNPLIACIGPVTAATAREESLAVGVVADEYTTEGLVKAIQDMAQATRRMKG